jgi:hypothetical protein
MPVRATVQSQLVEGDVEVAGFRRRGVGFWEEVRQDASIRIALAPQRWPENVLV